MDQEDPAVTARRLLRDDFEFYAKHALKIRTKAGKIEPLILNRAQEHLLSIVLRQIEDRGYVRVMILKGRQMGLSTLIGAIGYWWTSQREAQKTLVVAHDGKTTVTLFDMTRRYHKLVPDILRPHTEYSGRKELVFDQLDSAYTVATAGGDGIGRGETLQFVHMSEGAWWPKTAAQANRSGLLDAVPKIEGTFVFDESTANGVASEFYMNWKIAESGQGDFATCFCPWYWADEYRAKVPAGFERTPEETKLADLYGLEDEQLAYRRLKIAEKGLDLFRQEFPCCAEEAFLTSGRPVFPPDTIAEMLKAARKPIAIKTLAPDPDDRWVWEDSPSGELRCFLPHDPHETYYVGADVGGGVRKDYSVAQVFDSKRRQAAVWRSDRVDPDHFGTTLAFVGRFYNDAHVICERNNHGILTNRVLTKDEEYGNYYTETVLDKVSDKETTHVGFFSSEKSKPLVIGKLRANVRTREIEVYDETTLLEMQSYVINEAGKMTAEAGTHDDTVIALALADHVNEGSWTPLANQDSYYVKGEF